MQMIYITGASPVLQSCYPSPTHLNQIKGLLTGLCRAKAHVNGAIQSFDSGVLEKGCIYAGLDSGTPWLHEKHLLQSEVLFSNNKPSEPTMHAAGGQVYMVWVRRKPQQTVCWRSWIQNKKQNMKTSLGQTWGNNRKRGEAPVSVYFVANEPLGTVWFPLLVQANQAARLSPSSCSFWFLNQWLFCGRSSTIEQIFFKQCNVLQTSGKCTLNTTKRRREIIWKSLHNWTESSGLYWCECPIIDTSTFPAAEKAWKKTWGCIHLKIRQTSCSFKPSQGLESHRELYVQHRHHRYETLHEHSYCAAAWYRGWISHMWSRRL